MVRAKFTLVSTTQNAGSTPTTTLVFCPVSDGSEENKKFWKYTPNGRLEMTCVNADAVAQFELGKSYYLDFTPAE